jgi:signal transduction histidine kinase
MRTPVASIEGYLGLAMNPQTATIDARASAYLIKAHEASQHLGRLFQDLLDTTKIDDGRTKIHMQPVEIAALIKNIANDQAPNITAKNLTYQFGNPDQGRQLNQLIYAMIDVGYLHEIINNIIENAIKYTHVGSITVTARTDKQNVQIVITDTGIGIPREELSHIFQKFYRIDNSDTREIGGTGLGLYITKQLVEAMGGHIWAESEIGKGTNFIISLPRLSASDYEKLSIAETHQMLAPSNHAPVDSTTLMTMPNP